MQITIDNAIETTDYSVVNKPVRMVDIHYHTDAGYRGVYKIPKSEFDPKTIGAKLKADSEALSLAIGSTIHL
jgi:hypothetical protein